MNGNEERVCNRITDHLKEALASEKLSECNYHSREALQLFESVKKRSINSHAN